MMSKFEKIEEVDPKDALIGITIKNPEDFIKENGLRETERRDKEKSI